MIDILEKYRTYLLLFTTSAAAGGVLWGGVSWVDKRYAKTETVEKIEKKLDLNELNDQLRTAREELFFWRQQARKYPEDTEVEDALKEAEEQVESIKKKIEELDG